MRDLFTNRTLVIQPGQAVSGVAARPFALRIGSGRVWITVEGVGHDYFLHAGDTFNAVPGRLTVIEADQEARIESQVACPSAILSGVRDMLSKAMQRLSRSRTPQPVLSIRRNCDAPCC